MRNLDQLPSVLHDLSLYSGASNLLNQPPLLREMLPTQIWPDNLEEDDAQLESQEAEELAEIQLLASQFVNSLTPEQRITLEDELERLEPGAGEAFRVLA